MSIDRQAQATDPLPLATLAFLALALLPGLLRLAALWLLVEPDGISPGIQRLAVWDFANLWSGGALARGGDLATLFDETAYRAWLRATLSPRYGDAEWSYPPGALLLGVPFSLLGIRTAFLVWVLAGGVALYAALRGGGMTRAVAVAAVASPGMIETVMFGQYGAIAAALLCGALLLAPRRQTPAGILAGLLTIKPQLGILLPVAFLATRAWRAIAVAAATALALAGAAALAFGPEVWTLFWTRTRPLMVLILEAPWPAGHLANGATPFFALRRIGADLWLAQAVQAVATLAALAATAWAWRLPAADPGLRLAFTLPLALLATPYGYGYDLVALSVVAAILLQRDGWRIRALPVMAWIWPGMVTLLGNAGLPLTPVLLVLIAILAGRALAAEGGRVTNRR